MVFIQSYLCVQECNEDRARNLTPAQRDAKAAYKHDWREVIRCILCVRVHACSKTLPQLKNEDPEFHDASVKQNAAYNARPEVLARAAEWRNGDGYAGRIASDAVR